MFQVFDDLRKNGEGLTWGQEDKIRATLEQMRRDSEGLEGDLRKANADHEYTKAALSAKEKEIREIHKQMFVEIDRVKAAWCAEDAAKKRVRELERELSQLRADLEASRRMG